MTDRRKTKSAKKKTKPRPGTKVSSEPEPGHIELRLYIAGQTPKSMIALTNLDRICRDHIDGKYQLKIIDLLQNPQLAAEDQILAIPTLVRNLPTPIRKIIGDLSDTERVLVGLDLREAI